MTRKERIRKKLEKILPFVTDDLNAALFDLVFQPSEFVSRRQLQLAKERAVHALVACAQKSRPTTEEVAAEKEFSRKVVATVNEYCVSRYDELTKEHSR